MIITIDNMHQGYIFRVCSVCFLLFSVTGSADDVVHFVCLLYFIKTLYLLEGEGQEGEYVHAVNLSEKSKFSNEPKNTLYFLFWLTAKHNLPAAHAAADGQGDAWCLQGMAI